LPYPIETALTPQALRVNKLDIGMRVTDDMRRGTTVRDVPEESLMLTGDENIVDVDFSVFWQIKPDGASAYLFNIQPPEGTVKAVAESAMREIIGRSDFEYVRTKGQAATEREALVLIQQLLDNYHAGIEVSQVAMKNIAPPAETIAAFRDITAASQDAISSVNEAQGYYNQVTQNAEGQAQKIIKEAEAYKAQLIALATGEAQRFEAVLAAYQKAPDVTRRRLYLETMEQVLKSVDKVLIDPRLSGGAVPYLSLNELMKHAGSDAGAPTAGASTTGGSQ